ncbi:nociceptin receptor-like isoform X3 [Pomacea canaliculata]|uniref:nociceptin receptor-like isoform X2 n=1 Tax=Pomacea canaliculata TaxID=400727 RepID=UPI000D72BF3D|nr:nociceptin receptor-like isoform X2 [Pomacea canaliculata]XP_025091938.1 nociceptin receptor-like isoform X3 [Pomacea canaliculata]
MMEMENSSIDMCSWYYNMMRSSDRLLPNTSAANNSLNNCDYSPETDPPLVTSSMKVYTYCVPIILVIGLLGNLVSLRVFLSRNMRKLSASTYLAALSTSDITALLFHVLVDWLRWGLPSLNSDSAAPAFLNTPGVCHVLFYFSYVSRFLSAWFIVTFTVERYIGVCHPLRRKDICGSRAAHKVISSLVIIALVVMLYKPILTSARVVRTQHEELTRCFPDPQRPMLVFTLDSIYGLSITVLPFVLISVLNALIIQKLLRRYHRHRQCHVVTEESIIRMEFTVILLVVSFVFIILNLPFCIVWCKRFLLSRLHVRASEDALYDFDNLEGVLLLTRVVFYINYCVNFFLYSVTGAYFRHELKILVFYRSQRYSSYIKCSRVDSSPTTPQSWV